MNGGQDIGYTDDKPPCHGEIDSLIAPLAGAAPISVGRVAIVGAAFCALTFL